MKKIMKLFRANWKHDKFDPQKEVFTTNNSAVDTVDEYDTALTEIELRDR